jgi:hypothetical protein
MSDIQHDSSCAAPYSTEVVIYGCTCNLEQRLRDEIERLKAAIRKHQSIEIHESDDDQELYEVLEQGPPCEHELGEPWGDYDNHSRWVKCKKCGVTIDLEKQEPTDEPT